MRLRFAFVFCLLALSLSTARCGGQVQIAGGSDGAASDRSEPDTTPVADALTDLIVVDVVDVGDAQPDGPVTLTCAGTVASACPDAPCFPTLGQAKGYWCSMERGTTEVVFGPCGGYEILRVSFADSVDIYYFDSGGNLVAFTESGVSGVPACTVGPATFTVPDTGACMYMPLPSCSVDGGGDGTSIGDGASGG
jgi:hypothetical protein